VAAVAAAAERAGDVETIAFWWALGHEALVDGTPFDVEELAEVPGVAELRAIVERTNAHRFELPYGRRPEPEHLDVMDDELQNWWYRL
ncbi:MAG TPA: hypothetical protein VN408_36830, partial [Actinoplanes sp.]|nr:hypothetical protein [Actinoplanes sp.]